MTLRSVQRSSLDMQRKRFRFKVSLRTFLIASAVIAAVLALILRPYRELRRETRSIARLRAAGAQIQLSTVGVQERGRDLLQPILGAWLYLRATDINLSTVAKPSMADLGELRHAERVILQGAKVRDEELVVLEKFADLQELSLANSTITDAGLVHLLGLKKLRKLDLRHTAVSDQGIKSLAGLDELATLKVFGTRCTYQGLESLERGREMFNFREQLALESFEKVHGQVSTDRRYFGPDQMYVSETARWVGVFDGGPGGKSGPSDRDMIHLRYMPNVSEIDVVTPHLTDAGMAPLANLRRLKKLESYHAQITDKGLAYLRDIDSLEELAFYGAKITDAGLAHLGGLRNLKTLRLETTGVTGTGFGHLRGCTRLAHLTIVYYGRDARGIARRPSDEQIAAAREGSCVPERSSH